jgi:hypothetical protein
MSEQPPMVQPTAEAVRPTSEPASSSTKKRGETRSLREAADFQTPMQQTDDGLIKSVPSSQPRYIHFIDGEKGGVGKTMLARVMVQWFIDHKLPFRAAEADRSNTDLLDVYPDHTALVMVSENERLSGKTDGLFQMASQSTVVVDLPSQAFRPIADWIERNDLIEASAEYGIQIAKWFVSSGDHTSLRLFEETLRHFNGTIPHVLVRNLHSQTDWGTIEQNHQYQSLVQSYGVTVIDLPRLGYDERDLIDQHRLSFDSALAGNQLTVLQKTRVRKFLKGAYTAIESTGLLPVVNG